MSEFDKMIELVKMLNEKGYTDGYAFHGTELVLWEHEENPPAPLKRPE